MSRGNASSPKGIHQGSSPWRGAKKINKNALGRTEQEKCPISITIPTP
ncbi:MAG: hypothetical protein Q4G08_04050 [Capnocytophaga sp.]|nr:hypothetical protein [Capnocytophaga sp.]